MAGEENLLDLSGKELGGYQILEKIGKGGMASVYKAYQPSLNRHVAIKVLSQYYADIDSTFLKRFQREAQAIASLRHPNILMVIDYGENDGMAYLVMDYVEAGTLREELIRSMSLERIRLLIGQIGDALDHAHSVGIVHRDVKPTNILMSKPNWAVLTDFGLARVADGSMLTQSGLTVGTPTYMSPEQGSGGRVDSRSDIYSLGVILYEIVVGEVPYTADTPMAVVVKHITEPLPVLSGHKEIPEVLQQVVLKALAKNPDERYQSAGELVTALDEVLKKYPDWHSPEPTERFDRTTQIATERESDKEVQRTSPARTRARTTDPAPKGKKTGSGISSVLRGLTGTLLIGLFLIAAVVGGLIYFTGRNARADASATAESLTVAAASTNAPPPSVTPVPATPTEIPTLPPAAIPAVGVAIPPTPGDFTILYQDDFSDLESGWSVEADRESLTSYADNGTFNIQVLEAEYVVWSNPGLELGDVRVEVDARLVSGSEENGIGIICSYVDDSNFYMAEISSDGYYSVWEFYEGEWNAVNDEGGLAFSEDIPTGNGYNRLRVDCIGDTITLYVNGIEIVSVSDLELSLGDVGIFAELYTGETTEVEFDNFIIIQP